MKKQNSNESYESVLFKLVFHPRVKEMFFNCFQTNNKDLVSIMRCSSVFHPSQVLPQLETMTISPSQLSFLSYTLSNVRKIRFQDFCGTTISLDKEKVPYLTEIEMIRCEKFHLKLSKQIKLCTIREECSNSITVDFEKDKIRCVTRKCCSPELLTIEDFPNIEQLQLSVPSHSMTQYSLDSYIKDAEFTDFQAISLCRSDLLCVNGNTKVKIEESKMLETLKLKKTKSVHFSDQLMPMWYFPFLQHLNLDSLDYSMIQLFLTSSVPNITSICLCNSFESNSSHDVSFDGCIDLAHFPILELFNLKWTAPKREKKQNVKIYNNNSLQKLNLDLSKMLCDDVQLHALSSLVEFNVKVSLVNAEESWDIVKELDQDKMFCHNFSSNNCSQLKISMKSCANLKTIQVHNENFCLSGLTIDADSQCSENVQRICVQEVMRNNQLLYDHIRTCMISCSISPFRDEIICFNEKYEEMETQRNQTLSISDEIIKSSEKELKEFLIESRYMEKKFKELSLSLQNFLAWLKKQQHKLPDFVQGEFDEAAEMMRYMGKHKINQAKLQKLAKENGLRNKLETKMKYYQKHQNRIHTTIKYFESLQISIKRNLDAFLSIPPGLLLLIVLTFFFSLFV